MNHSRHLLPLVFALVALVSLSACASSDSYRAAEDAMNAGNYQQALQHYDTTLAQTYYPAEFDRAAQRRCDALDQLIEPSIADAQALPSSDQRWDALLNLRAQFNNCDAPTGRSLVDDALNAEALAIWKHQIAPLLKSNQLFHALTLAHPLASELPGTYEIWQRYTLLRAELHQLATAQLSSAPQGLSRAFYQNLSSLLATDQGSIPPEEALSSQFDNDYYFLPLTAVDLASKSSQLPDFCTSLTDQLLRDLPEPPASAPLSVTLSINGCQTSTSTENDTIVNQIPYYEERTVTEEVCRSYTVPVTVREPARRVCGGPSRCYQTSNTHQTCFQDCRYVGGGTTTRNETRQRCAMEDVTRQVQLWREERIPGHRALRTLQLSGSARITNELGQSTSLPFQFSASLPSELVPRTSLPSAPSIETVQAELHAQILAQLPSQLRSHYASSLLLPQLQSAFPDLPPGRQLDLAIALSLHDSTDILNAQGRTWLTTLTGVNDPTLSALFHGATDFHPTPHTPNITTPLFDYQRIPLDHPASIAIHGVAPFQALFTGRLLHHEGFPTQDPRQGTMVHFGYRMNMANGFLDRYLGWIYQDQLDLLLSIGARTSEGQILLDEVGESRREERGLAYGYRFSYTGMYGFRGPSMGAFLGLKLQRSGDRTGHLFTAGAAFPAVLQLEFRHNPTYPIILQAWGGDLDVRRFNRTFGASLALPAGINRWFYASAEQRNLRTQFYALTENDRIDAGPRTSWEFHLGMSFGIALGP